MPTKRSPRKGSLQFWPRKRARKFLPSVNWDAINSENTSKNLKGFIGYKVGMASISVKDNTPNSMTKGKVIVLPATILECPTMKILSARFYKNGKVESEILVEGLDKELKSVIKLPKVKSQKSLEEINSNQYEDVRIIAYSQTEKTDLKKTPDVIEIGLTGSFDDKLKFVKEHFGKEISIKEVFSKGQLIDVRGLTKGKGFSGTVKRFGVQLKQHKTEKGRRRPGSLGPWHPARVTFRAPMAGQLGMFTRVTYNSKLIDIKNPSEDAVKGVKNFGDVKTEYIVIHGSIQGPEKRQLLITSPLRQTKKQAKKSYDFLEFIK